MHITMILPIAVPSVTITVTTVSADDGLVRSMEDFTNPWSSLIVMNVSLKHMIVTKMEMHENNKNIYVHMYVCTYTHTHIIHINMLYLISSIITSDSFSYPSFNTHIQV